MSDQERLASDSDRAVTLRTAVRQLEPRLAAFVRYFVAAIESDCRDEEAVHQLRVFARRSSAAIAMFSELLPRKPAKWVRRQLKRVRRAAGVPRDLDVLIKRYGELADTGGKSKQGARRFVWRLRKQRQAAQRPLRRLYARLIESGKLARQQQALLTGLESEPAAQWEQPFEPWARQRIAPIIEAFFTAGSPPLASEAQVHAFRLRTKRLRYSLEVLADALPGTDLTAIKPAMSRLQSIQGEINDHAVACGRLKAAAKLAKGSQRRYLKKQRRQERQRFRSALQRLHAIWTVPAAAELRSRLEG